MDIRTSPLVEMAGEAKRPTRWWLAWPVAILLFIIVGGGIGSAIGAAILGNPAQTDTLYQFNEFFAFGATLLLLFLWVRFKEGRPVSSIGFRGKNPIGKFLLGLVLGALMMSIGVGITWALGQYEPGISTHTNLGSAALVPVVALLFVFFLQAATEESVTRGYMLQVGGRQINSWAAIFGSSILFAVMHLDFHPIVLLNITLYAVFASFVALGAGSLWLICGLHAGWNYFQGNIFGVPVSGNPEASSLWAFGPAEGSSDLLTGGDFGVEASLVGSAVLVVALIVSFVYFRRQQAARFAPASAVTGAA